MERNHEDDGPTYALSAGAKRSVSRSRGRYVWDAFLSIADHVTRWSYTLSVVIAQIDQELGDMDEVFARGAAYAASRLSSTLKGSTKQFGWLQAPATEDSFVSVISMNPATIRICTAVIILGLRIVRPSVTVSPNPRASSLETERKTRLAISILAMYY